jgi:RNA polymerase sigma-70 factor (ECF subfamily)
MAELSVLTDDTWKSVETRLRAYVGRRVDPGSVDDIVATILLRLVKHQDELTGARTPSAWILRVAANTIADHHRRRATEARALARSALEPQDEAESEQTAIASAKAEIAGCLVPMIRRLPETYCEALMLIDIKGLTQAEAAKRLGLSVSGLKSRVHRGRAKLKDALLRCCAIELDRRGGVVDYRPRSRG